MMKRFAAALLATALLGLPACSSGSSGGTSSASPEDLITVRVTNTTGQLLSVSYTFARTPASGLGSVPRGAEGLEFKFPWEPGRLEFLIEGPGALATSNGVSSRRGDVFELRVGRGEARVTRVEQAN